MKSTAPPSWEALRAEAVAGLFAGGRPWALLLFDVAVVALMAYVAGTAAEPWRRQLATAALAAAVALALVRRDRWPRASTSARAALTLGAVAVSGGPSSPLVPILVLGGVAQPLVLGRRASLLACGAAIAGSWALTPRATPSQATPYLATACTSLLLLGAYGVGLRLRAAAEHWLRAAREARDELVRSHGERLRELSRLQEALAHELKNPLASIKGLAGLAELEPPLAGEHLAVLQKEVCRMQHIVEDHLSFARPLTPLVAAPTELRALVAWVARLHEAAAREKEVVIDCAGAAPVTLVGDAGKLRQMLIHLVSNAVEASGRGGVVEVTAACAGERVRLAVLDRGPGLDAHMLTRAVEPGVTTKANGAGLGLTIARALAAQHGGRLCLQPRPGGGLVAEVELPRGEAVATPDGAASRVLTGGA